MARLKALEVKRLASPDGQISLTDPDARSMATSGRGTGMVGYNVQTAVDTTHHLIVEHEVTNVGNDRTQLYNMGKRTKDTLAVDALGVVADRGYYNSHEIRDCENDGVSTYLPKTATSTNMARGLFGRRDFIYKPDEDEYECPAGERAIYRFSRVENNKVMRRYWSSACPTCEIKSRCTTGVNRRISRWEHEAMLDTVEARLDQAPQMMRVRRQTVEHPFGTLKAWMGAHALPNEDATEGQYGDESACTRLQSQTDDEHFRNKNAHRGDKGLRAFLTLKTSHARA